MGVIDLASNCTFSRVRWGDSLEQLLDKRLQKWRGVTRYLKTSYPNLRLFDIISDWKRTREEEKVDLFRTLLLLQWSLRNQLGGESVEVHIQRGMGEWGAANEIAQYSQMLRLLLESLGSTEVILSTHQALLLLQWSSPVDTIERNIYQCLLQFYSAIIVQDKAGKTLLDNQTLLLLQFLLAREEDMMLAQQKRKPLHLQLALLKTLLEKASQPINQGQAEILATLQLLVWSVAGIDSMSQDLLKKLVGGSSAEQTKPRLSHTLLTLEWAIAHRQKTQEGGTSGKAAPPIATLGDREMRSKLELWVKATEETKRSLDVQAMRRAWSHTTTRIDVPTNDFKQLEEWDRCATAEGKRTLFAELLKLLLHGPFPSLDSYCVKAEETSRGGDDETHTGYAVDSVAAIGDGET